MQTAAWIFDYIYKSCVLYPISRHDLQANSALRRHTTDAVLIALEMCSNSVDLNRNYPDPMLLGANNLGPRGFEQPETLAIMKWTSDIHFVAGASMHEVLSVSSIIFSSFSLLIYVYKEAHAR